MPNHSVIAFHHFQPELIYTTIFGEETVRAKIYSLSPKLD